MMNLKSLPRPARRAVSNLAASMPIPFVVTCAGMNLPWPEGERCPKHHTPLDVLSMCDECLQEEAAARSRVRNPNGPTLLHPCEECGEYTSASSSWCPQCDPFGYDD